MKNRWGLCVIKGFFLLRRSARKLSPYYVNKKIKGLKKGLKIDLWASLGGSLLSGFHDVELEHLQ